MFLFECQNPIGQNLGQSDCRIFNSNISAEVNYEIF